MGLFASRSDERPAPPRRSPRDVEALEEFVANLESATGEASTWRIMASTYAESYDMDYAAIWRVEGGTPRLEYEVGRIAASLAGTQPALVQQAIRGREPVYADDRAAAADPRLAAAIRAGAKAGIAMAIVRGGAVTAVLELYGRHELAVDGALTSKWGAIMRVAEQARQGALAAFVTRQLADDRLAVTTVVDALGHTEDSNIALRSALDAVRKAFGWAYGSYWHIDEDEGVLKFKMESGSAGEEFRKVTLAATFAEGVGLSGRAWRQRDLVFVRNIGELTDCVRAPAATRAGVRSEQIAALQATAESVAAGIRTTSDTIGQMDAVQARIGEVLEEQATMAHAFER